MPSGPVVAHVDAGAVDFGGRVGGPGTISAGVGFSAEIGDVGGKDDVSAGGLDGIVPVVAGNIPVELIMIVEEAKGVGDNVFDGNGASGVVGIGNKDFEFAVLTLAAGFIFQGAAIFVADGFDVEK